MDTPDTWYEWLLVALSIIAIDYFLWKVWPWLRRS